MPLAYWSISWCNSALHVKADDSEMKSFLTQTALWDKYFSQGFFFLQSLKEICSHFTCTPQYAYIICICRPVEHSFTSTNNAIIQTGCLTETLAQQPHLHNSVANKAHLQIAYANFFLCLPLKSPPFFNVSLLFFLEGGSEGIWNWI